MAYARVSSKNQERDDADARSDLWALGAVIYEMVTGVCGASSRRYLKGEGL